MEDSETQCQAAQLLLLLCVDKFDPMEDSETTDADSTTGRDECVDKFDPMEDSETKSPEHTSSWAWRVDKFDPMEDSETEKRERRAGTVRGVDKFDPMEDSETQQYYGRRHGAVCALISSIWACAERVDTIIRYRCPMVRKIYTSEFKEQAIKLSYSTDKSVSETAADLGLPTNMLHRWRREAKQTGRAFTGHGKVRDEEMAELKKRLKQAELERDILKKAVSFFAAQPK